MPEGPKGYYRRVAETVAQIADGLQAAHEVGIVHRDIKPRNLLLTPGGRPKVADFGVARVSGDSVFSRSGEIAGTWAYMSPEQVTGKHAAQDRRSDVFSLGIVLYELLTLRRPFEGDTEHQIVAGILAIDPPEPSRVRSQCPRELGIIARKALEKAPERRYRSMAELAADLRRYLANEPIHAQLPGPWTRAVKWARRHPTVSVAAALGTLALVVVSALLLNNLQTNRVLAKTSEDVVLLSASENLKELIARADSLWPPHPDRIEAYGRWIEDARRLCEGMERIQARQAELFTQALPDPGTERWRPEAARIEELRGEIAVKRAALLQRRDGVQAELPELPRDWHLLARNARGLNEVAWHLVRPDRPTLGREGEGLVLAEKALDLAVKRRESRWYASIHDTLARAFFALGRDEEALEMGQAALESAIWQERADFERYLEELEGLGRRSGQRRGNRGGRGRAGPAGAGADAAGGALPGHGRGGVPPAGCTPT